MGRDWLSSRHHIKVHWASRCHCSVASSFLNGPSAATAGFLRTTTMVSFVTADPRSRHSRAWTRQIACSFSAPLAKSCFLVCVCPTLSYQEARWSCLIRLVGSDFMAIAPSCCRLQSMTSWNAAILHGMCAKCERCMRCDAAIWQTPSRMLHTAISSFILQMAACTCWPRRRRMPPMSNSSGVQRAADFRFKLFQIGIRRRRSSRDCCWGSRT